MIASPPPRELVGGDVAAPRLHVYRERFASGPPHGCANRAKGDVIRARSVRAHVCSGAERCVNRAAPAPRRGHREGATAMEHAPRALLATASSGADPSGRAGRPATRPIAIAPPPGRLRHAHLAGAREVVNLRATIGRV
jgi:hypothetical protein